MQLVLASSSPYRRALLQQLGVAFVQKSPDLDESLVQTNTQLQPKEVAKILALEKALLVQKAFPESVIIASDQVASVDEKVLTKPKGLQKAKEQMQMLSGRKHQLFTAVCILSPQAQLEHIDTTNLYMRDLSVSEIDSYLLYAQPYDTAGSYKIEKAGIALFDKIESEDFTAIQGLPLIWVSECLRKLGCQMYQKQ